MLFQRNYSKETPRMFTVNGAMDQDAKEKFFYVDPSETNKKELIPQIQKGEYIMFYGSNEIHLNLRIKRKWKKYKHQQCSLTTSTRILLPFCHIPTRNFF
jgi:hypothetical protein